MFKEWDEIWVLAGWCLVVVGGIFAHNAIIGRGIGMDLDPLLLIESSMRAADRESDGVRIVVVPLNG